MRCCGKGFASGCLACAEFWEKILLKKHECLVPCCKKDIEEITFSRPDRLRKLEVDIGAGVDHTQLFSLIEGLSLDGLENSIADVL